MAVLPLSLLFGKWSTFANLAGAPLALGQLQFFIAGTTTPQAVYADSLGATSLGFTVNLTGIGQPTTGSNPTGIYLLPTGYKLRILDSTSALIYEQDNIEDVGAAFLGALGTFLATGSTVTVTDGYTVPSNNAVLMVIANMTTTGVLNLPPVSSRTQPLTCKNVGSVPMLLTPNGTDNLETLAASATYSVAAAATPTFPSAVLLPNGVSTYWIQSSHGIG